MVKDIAPSVNGSSAPELDFTSAQVNNTLYFSADDGSHGQELWQSDGTDAGTSLVKDIRPGADSSGITGAD